MSTVPETSAKKPASPLSIRNFRLLWIGEGISLLGDQFYMIALPWLVLQLTGSALALGTVMAIAAIPRALFMLVGGAVVDRFSPRGVMLASNAARFVLVAVLTVLVLTNNIRLELLYGFALAFGLADAFYFPGQTAIVPQLLPEAMLQAGNTFVQGTAQLSLFLGPVVAGALIALVGHSASADAAPGTQGIGIAFGFDTLTFVVSVLCLGLMRIPRREQAAGEQQNVIESIRTGMVYVWNQRALRVLFLLMVAMNFLVLGPIVVGIPVLADTRLPEGAAAFGIMMSAFGGGALLGIILSNVVPIKSKNFGQVLLAIASVLGIGVALMPLFNSTVVEAAIMLVLGISNGYVNIHFFTWLQKLIPQALMGRVMSLLMFTSIGLAPVTNALAGAVSQVNLNLLFIGGGTLMALISLFAIALPAVREMGADAPASTQATSTAA